MYQGWSIPSRCSAELQSIWPNPGSVRMLIMLPDWNLTMNLIPAIIITTPRKQHAALKRALPNTSFIPFSSVSQINPSIYLYEETRRTLHLLGDNI